MIEIVDTTNNETIIPIWDQDIDPHVQSAIDRVLDFMIMRGVSPQINISGHILDSAVQIAEDFPAFMPPHLTKDGEVIAGYLLKWIADYAEETNATHMNLSLRLQNAQAAREGVSA